MVCKIEGQEACIHGNPGDRVLNCRSCASEKYGFFNDARGTFGPPSFADAAFEIGDGAVSRIIHLH